MSFGRSSGRSSSFGREKKEKKRKQDFHKHKVKITEEQEAIDFASLKEKTLLSIAHLGKQQFSEEPSGYGYENWIKNFNLVLEQFEDGAGPANLPPEYFQKKHELNPSLSSQRIDSSKLDPEIDELEAREKMMEKNLQKMGSKLAHVRAGSDISAKIDSFNVERADLIEKLEEDRKKLAAKKKEAQESNKFFKRLFGKPKSVAIEIATISREIDDLETKVRNLEERIEELRDRKTETGYRILSEEELEQEFPQQFQELASVRSKLEELQTKRATERDTSKTREETASSMSELISKIELSPSKSIEEAASPSSPE